MASTCADPSAAAPPRRPRPNSGCRCFAFFCDGPRTFAPPTHCSGMETHLTAICECDVTSHCHRAWSQKSLCAHMHTKRDRTRALTRPRLHTRTRLATTRTPAPTRPREHARTPQPARARRTRLARPHARNAHTCTRTCARTPHARTHARAAQTHRAHPHLPASLPAAHDRAPRPPRWRSHLFRRRRGAAARVPERMRARAL